MKKRSYHGELRTATAQILDVFNNIVIDRRNSRGVQKLISVPCVYGNRSRVLKSFENKNKSLKPPLICISKGSLSRDVTRVADTNNGLLFQSGGSSSKYNTDLDKPNPINIEFEMSIITKYEDDMDQVISNFIAMLRPDCYVVWPNPKELNKNLKSQIIWDGEISYEYPMDISETDPYRIITTTNFTYKTWMFPGLDEYENKDIPLIHKIDFCPNLLTIEDGNYGLDRWYDVPMRMSFEEYENKIVCGMIKMDRGRPNWDWLPCSGEVSGSYDDILSAVCKECFSGMCSGSTMPELSGLGLKYIINNENNIVILG